MALHVEPDVEDYLDHLVEVSEPGVSRLGEPRLRQALWLQAAADLRRAAGGAELAVAVEVALRQGFVLTTAQARAAGVTPGRYRTLLRKRLWTQPRRGVLSPLAPTPPRTPRFGPKPRPGGSAFVPHGHAVQIHATAASLVRPDTFVSHESAVAMYGLPTLGTPRCPTLTAIEIARSVSSSTAIVRGVGIRADHVTGWFGAPVMTLERTVIDVARNGGVAAGLIAADAALNDGLTTRDALLATRFELARRPGIKSAERALELASPLAESPLESLTRLCLVNAGLPTPELQVVLQTGRGDFRVDLLYRRQRVVVEADGELKYQSGQALTAEKRRQEALEQAGWTVVRVSWQEVRGAPHEVAGRVHRALNRPRFAAA
ncbi:DUF559 domain-containing protein [uncultured Jatrophihabitans sp.]|uniref:DUF559 domain-containing protein n=1 Tax=uncultured Jatrophihabitans sp. TaxID=1610747 RepID=UPI0035CBC67E